MAHPPQLAPAVLLALIGMATPNRSSAQSPHEPRTEPTPDSTTIARPVPRTGFVIMTDSIAPAPITSFSELLQGRAPGLAVQRSNGFVDAASDIRLRGPNSLLFTADPGHLHWRTHASLGGSTLTTTFPTNYAQIGVQTGGTHLFRCTLLQQLAGDGTPIADSLLRFNPLEERSPFATGGRTDVGVSASGGGRRASGRRTSRSPWPAGTWPPGRGTRGSTRR
jgi:hypothetical protein